MIYTLTHFRVYIRSYVLYCDKMDSVSDERKFLKTQADGQSSLFYAEILGGTIQLHRVEEKVTWSVYLPASYPLGKRYIEANRRNANKVVLYDDVAKKQLLEFISALRGCELMSQACSSLGEGVEALAEDVPAKPVPYKCSSKRRKAAEVHNVSEKVFLNSYRGFLWYLVLISFKLMVVFLVEQRRRRRIKEKMKALQHLSPNSIKIYKLELEQKRLEEDAFVYNSLQQQPKLSPVYQKVKSRELVENRDDEFANISFEELLAQEKKDSFWRPNSLTVKLLVIEHFDCVVSRTEAKATENHNEDSKV
ncbi:hypothetical protein AHAS_Ahas07G0094900 [Arachis hypogaea]